MSKKNEVLAKAEELARELGAGHAIDRIKRELSAIWGDKDEAEATPVEETDTFNVLVGVEVKRSAGAYQSAVEDRVLAALESAAAGQDEVVSISVTNA